MVDVCILKTNFKILTRLADSEHEKGECRLDVWLSSDVSSTVAIVHIQDEPIPTGKATYNALFKTSAEMRFQMKRKCNPFTNINFQFYTRIRLESGVWVWDQSGKEQFPLKQCVKGVTLSGELEVMLQTVKKPKATFTMEVIESNVRDLPQEEVNFNLDTYRLQFLEYKKNAEKFMSARQALHPEMTYMHAPYWQSNRIYAPSTLYSAPVITERNDEYWMFVGQLISWRHGYADSTAFHNALVEYKTKHGKWPRSAYVALAQMISLFAQWCHYNYDRADFNSNRFTKIVWNILERPSGEAYDDVSHTHSDDCETLTAFIIRSALELQWKPFDCPFLAVIRDVSLHYLFFSALTGVTTAAISSDTKAELTPVISSDVVQYLKEMNYKKKAISPLARLFGDYVAINSQQVGENESKNTQNSKPFFLALQSLKVTPVKETKMEMKNPVQITTQEKREKYGGHAWCIGIPIPVLMKMIKDKKLYSELEVLFRKNPHAFASEYDEAFAMPLEGTGILRPEPMENPGLDMLRAIFTKDSMFYEKFKTEFFFTPEKYSFYRWCNTIYSPIVLENRVIPGFLLRYASNSEYSVRFGSLFKDSSELIAEPWPELSHDFYDAARFHIRDIEPRFLPLCLKTQPVSALGNLAPFLINSNTRAEKRVVPASHASHYTEIFVAYDFMNPQVGNQIVKDAQSLGYILNIWEENIARGDPRCGGYRIRYTKE